MSSEVMVRHEVDIFSQWDVNAIKKPLNCKLSTRRKYTEIVGQFIETLMSFKLNLARSTPPNPPTSPHSSTFSLQFFVRMPKLRPHQPWQKTLNLDKNTNQDACLDELDLDRNHPAVEEVILL